MRADVHVNLLPPFARQPDAGSRLDGETESMRRAFAHPDAPRLHQLCNADDIIREMDNAGIDTAVCFSYQWADEERCVEANAEMVRAISQSDERLKGLAVVQPHSANAPDMLEKAMSNPGVLGLKLKPKWGAFSLADAAVLGPLVEIIQARKGFVLAHITQNFHVSEGDNLAELYSFLKNFPDVNIVAAHLGAFIGVYECYEPFERLMGRLYIDISLPANLMWLPHLMRLGNPHRYLFGSDFPYLGMQDLDNRLESIGLTEAELALLRGGNAARLFAGEAPS